MRAAAYTLATHVKACKLAFSDRKGHAMSQQIRWVLNTGYSVDLYTKTLDDLLRP